jgi:transcriptional regulator with XRE-family HTH domain
MTPAKPHAATRLAKYLSKRILELRPKTQAEIASQAGFVNPNMMTIIKQGGSRLPLDRVTALAKALDVDPAYLMLLALEQAVGPTEAATIVDVMGNTVTDNEMTWVQAIREASDVTDPPITRRGRAAIFGVFGK